MLEVEEFSERGDAPALAILKDNARKKAVRQVVETQEELTRIHERVTRTIDAYELSEKLSGHQLDEKEVERIAEDFIREQATLEFVDDMTQLLIILSDPVAKRKLLAQLQEFFLQNNRGEEQFEIEPPDFDIEDVGAKVRDALDKAEKATQRLATVSKDVIKALEIVNPKETKKGKKKLEKALQQSQHDIMSLTEKLIRVQNDLEESEGKMSQMYKSVEIKQVEIERLKVQGENAKKAAETVKELKSEIAVKETDLQRAQKTIAELELSVAHLEDKQERDFERHKRVREENQKSKDMYEEKIRDQQQYIADVRSELKQHYDEQVKEMEGKHHRELTQIRDDHKVEINRMQRALEVARRKSEELKIELSDSSKRNSVAGESGSSKRNSLFSPEGSDGGESPRKLSLKSSAQAVRFLNKGRNLSDTGSGSEHSDSSSTPLNKSSTPSQTSPAVEVTEDKTSDSLPGKSLSRRGSKTEKSKKERSSRVSPEKPGKSKSPDKAQAVVEPFEKSGGSTSEKKQSATTELTPAEIQVTTAVEMVDVGIQSETEDLSDIEAGVQGTAADRKPSLLQVVPEEEHEDCELDSLSKENLIEKLEDYKTKAQARQKKLELELAELKNKYMMKTNALKKQNEEFQNSFQKEKEAMLSRIKEAEQLKEQAEKEAEQAVLQLEEVLSEQEEMRQLKEKALQNRQEEQTMTGLSLYDRHEEQTMTSGSLFDKQEQETMTSKSLTNMREEQTMTSLSLDHEQATDSNRHHSIGSQSSRQSSAQLIDTGTEGQVAGRGLSPRDSGFDGAGSSLKFDSRPSSGTAIIPKLETDESAPPESKPGMLSPPERRTVMSARARRRLINSALNEHPVAQETLKTYDAVLQFTENMVQWLVEEGLGEQANLVKSVKPVLLNKEDTMQIIESMPEIRSSIAQILNELGSVLSSQHLAHSTAVETKSVGLATSQQDWRPKSVKKADVGDTAAMEPNYVKLLKEYNDLAEGYERLQQHLDEETKFHQEQTSQNVAVMTDMQDTITQLRNQLAELRNTRSASSGRTSSSIMFTRLDAERNGKILKRAVNERRLSEGNFSVIMEHMDNYVDLPAKRLAHIVRRYSHHRSMKDIEQSLKQSGNLDEGVFSALDKMEALQNNRAQRWGDKMDRYANERERLAEQLTACFENLEQETGIFLIKPVYSVKGRPEVNGGYVIARRHKPSPLPPQPSGPATPAPTPWLQLGKGPMSAGLYRDLTQSSLARAPSSIPAMAQLEDGTMRTRVTRPMDKGTLMNASVGVAWQASKSQVVGTPSTAVEVNTPKILELDVNRMMIGQTDVSKPIIPLDDAEEVTGSVVRSYVTVERPTGGKQIRKARQYTPGTGSRSPPNTAQDPTRPHSGPLLSQYSPLPPIHMPKLQQESRSGKSHDSDTVTHSEAGSPVARKFEDTRPSTQGTVNGKDTHIGLLTPEVLPVR